MKRQLTTILAGLMAIFAISGCQETKEEQTTIELNPKTLTLKVGTSQKLEIVATPATAKIGEAKWTSNKESVATVKDGVVTGIAEGTATITANADGKTATCEVTVTEIPVESVTLNLKETKLKVGETAQLEVTVAPDNAKYGTIEYKSDKPEIASVSDKGLIKAESVGDAVITVTVGGKTATCAVTVQKIEVESIALDIEAKTLMIGKTVQLTALIYPETASDKTLQWQSSAKEVATVNDKGLVTAVAPGKAAITVSCGTKAAVCNITVLGKAKVGDYYYSDGTYSSELSSDKTPIGVVFYVGNPAADDKALQREHPDCTNGLVVALKDINNNKKVAFQKNMHIYRDGVGKQYGSTIGGWVEANAKDYETTICGEGVNARVNKMLGYNNTKAMELFNKANAETPIDAINEIIKFRESVPAPKGTSDWYMPSIKDLAVLFWGEIKEGVDIVTTYDYLSDDFLKKLIDPKIKAVPGGIKVIADDPYTKDTYFSSSELNVMHAMGMWVPEGSWPEPNTGKNSQYHCRAILAF